MKKEVRLLPDCKMVRLVIEIDHRRTDIQLQYCNSFFFLKTTGNQELESNCACANIKGIIYSVRLVFSKSVVILEELI